MGRAGAAGGADVLRRRLHRRHGVVAWIRQLHRLLVSLLENHKPLPVDLALWRHLLVGGLGFSLSRESVCPWRRPGEEFDA